MAVHPVIIVLVDKAYFIQVHKENPPGGGHNVIKVEQEERTQLLQSSTRCCTLSEGTLHLSCNARHPFVYSPRLVVAFVDSSRGS